MDIYKLSKHKYAQCGMFQDTFLAGRDGWLVEWGFVSYSTKVIIVRGSRVIFTGHYSQTTSKQLSWWLEQFGDRLKGLDKKTLDIMDKKHFAYDFKTGELSPLTEYEERERTGIRKAAFNYSYGW